MSAIPSQPNTAKLSRRPKSPISRPTILLLLFLLISAAVSLSNPSFLSAQNLLDLLVQSAPVIIVGGALTLVILAGEIDISVGSLLGLLAALLGILSSPQHLNLSITLVIPAILIAGAAIGLINGLLVTVGRVPSIIATLGTLTILRGVTDLLLEGKWITDVPRGIRAIATGAPAGVIGHPWGWVPRPARWILDFLADLPFSLWTAGLVTALSILLLHRTPLGLHIRAVGGNPDAVANAGLSPTRTRIAAFTLTGLATAIATLVTVPQLSTIESGIGIGFELTVITAVVVGGTSIRGGLGGITGTIIAAILLMSIRTSLVFLDLGPMATYWERAIQGAFILAAVLMDHLRRDRAASPLSAAERRQNVARGVSPG